MMNQLVAYVATHKISIMDWLVFIMKNIFTHSFNLCDPIGVDDRIHICTCVCVCVFVYVGGFL